MWIQRMTCSVMVSPHLVRRKACFDTLRSVRFSRQQHKEKMSSRYLSSSRTRIYPQKLIQETKKAQFEAAMSVQSEYPGGERSKQWPS